MTPENGSDYSGPQMPAEEVSQLRRLHHDERAELPSLKLAEWERRGLVMRGWNGSHVLTAEGEAAIGIGGSSAPKP